MGTLNIRLLGGLVLERDGVALPTPSPQKAALLLAYLLTAYSRTHPRALLAGLFWGDLPERRARRNLSDALWRIRILLEPDPATADSAARAPVLLFEADTVRVNPDADLTYDVRQFEELLREPTDPDRLARAVDLYQGDLLVGYYDDWILLERERLRQMSLAALTRLTAAYKTRGAWDAALAVAARLVAADPYHEEATRELMRLYYRLGRRDRALAQFATLKAALAADLEIEPEPETVALYQMMQDGMLVNNLDASAGPITRPGPGGPGAGNGLATLRHNLRGLPLVGRAAERATLAEWLAMPRPHPPMLILQGEAGVGKTRLAQDTAEEAYRHRMSVLWGHYHQLATPLPYAGFVEALRVGLQVAGPPVLEPIWLSEVSRLLPELATEYPGLPPPVHLPPDQERIRLWEALTRYLLALAAAGPHTFVLEDVQWIDTASLDFFQYALPRLRSSGVGLRLLGTVRSEDLSVTPGFASTLRNLEAQGMLGYVPLVRLDRADVDALVREALGPATPVIGFADHLWQETEGNPFFALETIRFWAEQGALTRGADGGWHAPENDYAALPTPASVRRVLEHRLARLSPAARAVIEVGSVLGRDVPENLLWRASGSTPEAVLGPAEELLRHQLWIEHPGGRGYRFAHQKVLEVTYAGISRSRRRHLHRMAAAALEIEQPDAVDRLAYHWMAAEEPARAIPYLQDAAARAVAAFASEDALVFYDQAIRAADTLPLPTSGEALDQLYSLLAGRATILKRLERMESATADLDRLMALARRSDQPGRVADALARRSAHFISQARYAEASTDLDAALGLALASGNAPAMARILTQLTRVRIRLGEHATAIEAAERALACYREIGDRRGEVEILSLLGPIYGQIGHAERAVQILEEALAKVRDVTNALPLEARILNNLGLYLAAPDASRELFERMLTIATTIESLPLQETAHENLADLLTRYGAYAAARDHLERAIALATTAGSSHDLGVLLTVRGQLRAAEGDPRARADFQEAVRTLDALGARFNSMLARLALGDYLLDDGAFEAGLAQVERGYALWQELDRPEGPLYEALFQAQMARAHAGLRRPGAARRAVRHARDALAVALRTPGTWADPIVEILAHCYTVLLALDQLAEAAAVLEQGYHAICARADGCGESLRAAYLENVPECRLLRAAYQDRAPAPGLGPPGDGAPPPAGPDEDLAEKVIARRAQILLMFRDAAGRGTDPDETDLARRFGVSLRTIQRDLAALRRTGRLPS